MIRFIKENRKELLILVGMLTIGTIALFLPTWLQGNWYVGGGDVRTQTYPFFVECKSAWSAALKNKTLPFYSWYDFLGSNIWASKSGNGLIGIYYFLAYLSPFNFWITYEIMCWLKILVAGISLYAFLSYLFKDKKWILLGSLCFGLSSYMVYFTSEPYFASFYSFIPIYFLGIEKYFRENKASLFIFGVALMLSGNFYLFYSLSLFTPVYFLYRYYNIKGTFKGWFLSAIKLIGFYLVGALICGVVFIPSAMVTIQNERVGSCDTRLFFDELKMYLHLISALIVPSQSYVYGNNIFNYGAHSLKEVFFYAGTVVTLVTPQILVCKDKKLKWSTIGMYLVFLLFIFTPIGGSITNGFSEVCFRWTYMFIFMNVMVFVQILEKKEEFSKKALWVTAISEIVLSIASFGVAIITQGEEFTQYIPQLLIFLITAVFILINAYAFMKGWEKRIIAITFAELCLFASCKGYVSVNTGMSEEEFEGITTVLADNAYELDYYLDNLEEGNDEEFFRVYVPQQSVFWDYSYNLNKIYKLNTLQTYDSSYTSSFDEMKAMNIDEIITLIGWQFDIQDTNLMNYLSTKYSITLKEEEIPFENYEIIDDQYRGSMIVARNLDCKSFGQTYSEIMTYEDFYGKGEADTALLNEYIICHEEDLETIGSYLKSDSISIMENIEYGTNYMIGTVESDDQSFLVLSLPYDEGWKILVNGQEVTKYKVNGGTIGIPIESGTNTIEMYFVPQGFKIGAVMTAIGTMAFVVIIIVEKRKKRV